METLHEVTDQDKLHDLIVRLERDGWQGAPLVVDGEQLITGVHRYNAARALDWTDSMIPTIELSDVFTEAGLDLTSLHAEYGYPTIDDADFVALIDELPIEIRERYGIDLH